MAKKSIFLIISFMDNASAVFQVVIIVTKEVFFELSISSVGTKIIQTRYFKLHFASCQNMCSEI